MNLLGTVSGFVVAPTAKHSRSSQLRGARPSTGHHIIYSAIKFFTVPLTLKSLRSSRNMQQVQPLIKEVQKKYGKDKRSSKKRR